MGEQDTEFIKSREQIKKLNVIKCDVAEMRSTTLIQTFNPVLTK